MAKPVSHQAANVRESLWVSAHAGTGKTYVLITRLLALLLAGVPPNKILCLTYMRAAANEMRERLLEALAEWAQADDTALRAMIAERLGIRITRQEAQRAKALHAEILRDSHDLRIQTIHSFCQELLQRFAVEANISPQFALETGAQSDARKQQIFMSYLNTEPSASFSLLARQVKEEQLLELFGRLRERDSSSVPVPQAHDLKEKLQLGNQTSYEEIVRSYLEKFTREGIRALAQEDTEPIMDYIKSKQWMEAWHLWCAKHLTGGSLRKKPFKEYYPKRFVDTYRTATASLAYELSMALQTLLAEQNDRLQASKQEIGAMDFDDLIRKARYLLCESDMAAWVQYKLDGGIDHILLDEAQDTNKAQWDIINALTAEFFAGAGQREANKELPPPEFFCGGR